MRICADDGGAERGLTHQSHIAGQLGLDLVTAFECDLLFVNRMWFIIFRPIKTLDKFWCLVDWGIDILEESFPIRVIMFHPRIKVIRQSNFVLISSNPFQQNAYNRHLFSPFILSDICLLWYIKMADMTWRYFSGMHDLPCCIWKGSVLRVIFIEIM